MCALFLAAASLSCAFEPLARPVQPEKIASGPYRVIRPLDPQSRYVHVQRKEDGGGAFRDEILEIQTKHTCKLPEGGRRLLLTPLYPPAERAEPDFLWPIVVPEDGGAARLIFFDPHCEPTSLPLDDDSSSGWKITLDDDAGEGLLLSDGHGKLSLVDPWRGRSAAIAEGVTNFASFIRPDDGTPGALWLIEGGELRLRTLDGKLLVTGLGSDVSSFQQTFLVEARVAFIDGGDLYEAVAPDYRPTLIAKDACAPQYHAAQLNFLAPCGDPQLYRIDLTSGALERFEDGVLQQSEQGGFTIEYGRDPDGATAMWITPPGGERARVTPVLSNVSVLDAQTLSGFSPVGDFGLWSNGVFRVLLERVRSFASFQDLRSGRPSFLTHHAFEDGLGVVSLIDESDLQGEVIATGVPAGGVLAQYVLQVPEAVVILVHDAELTGTADAPGYRGKLMARVLSGQLSSAIDEGVSSFELIPSTTVAGVLYAIDEGPRRGLWFAAL